MADGVATDGVAGGGPTQGWYRDPWDVEPLRWWDGQAWTGHTARPGDDGAPAVHARRGSSARAGDPIRTVEFRETLKGYRKDVVDQLLEQAAAEVDAGRVPTAVVNHAPFPESFTGYHRDDVDDYIRALAASPSSLPGPTSTIPSGRDDPIASPNPSSGSDQRPVRTARSATSPPRSAPKGWTPLKGALSAIFLVGGVIAVAAGAATWHSVASRPHVVAIVASQFHCVTDAVARGQSNASFCRTSYVALRTVAAGTMISVRISLGCRAVSREASSFGVRKNLATGTSRGPFAETSFTLAPSATSAGPKLDGLTK